MTKKFHKNVHQLETYENDRIELNCTVSSTDDDSIMKIEWMNNNNKKIIANSAKYVLKMKNKILIINSIGNQDSGLYTCRIETLDDIFIVENIVNLKKNNSEPKRIYKSTNTIDTTEMTDIEMNCGDLTNENNPVLKTRWIFNEIDLIYNPKYDFQKNNSILRINKVGFEDSGIYTCHVETLKSFFITENIVAIKRRLINVTSKFINIEINSQRGVRMDCFWWYKSDSFQNDTIKWYINDNKELDLQESDKYRFNNKKNVLYVNDVKLDDPLIYSCISYVDKYDVRISNFTIELNCKLILLSTIFFIYKN